MSTPDFILELRKHIGHMPLWLIGITAYVTDGDGRVLLGRRLDTGEWALVYGINEPAEDPADTVAREVREETGVDVIPTDLVSVKASTRMVTYANGDQTQYLDLTYLCRLDPSGNTSHSWATTKSGRGLLPARPAARSLRNPRWNAWRMCASICSTGPTATHTRSSHSAVKSNTCDVFHVCQELVQRKHSFTRL